MFCVSTLARARRRRRHDGGRRDEGRLRAPPLRPSRSTTPAWVSRARACGVETPPEELRHDAVGWSDASTDLARKAVSVSGLAVSKSAVVPADTSPSSAIVTSIRQSTRSASSGDTTPDGRHRWSMYVDVLGDDRTAAKAANARSSSSLHAGVLPVHRHAAVHDTSIRGGTHATNMRRGGETLVVPVGRDTTPHIAPSSARPLPGDAVEGMLLIAGTAVSSERNGVPNGAGTCVPSRPVGNALIPAVPASAPLGTPELLAFQRPKHLAFVRPLPVIPGSCSGVHT
jgi:hypothetical protein